MGDFRTRDPRQRNPAAKPPFVSACFGDSGSPMLAAGIDVGVVSWGPACGSQRDPEIYANVARVLRALQVDLEPGYPTI